VRIAELIMRAVGGPDWGGNTSVSGDHLALRVRPSNDETEVYATSNDGFELWIGWPNKWCWHTDRRTARRLAWFVLWTWWARGEWFGLRRAVYYRALRASLRRAS